MLNFKKLSESDYNLKAPNQRSYYYIVRKMLWPAQLIATYLDETNTQLSISNGRAADPEKRALIFLFLKRLKSEFIPGKTNDSNTKSSFCNYASLMKVLKKSHQTEQGEKECRSLHN